MDKWRVINGKAYYRKKSAVPDDIVITQTDERMKAARRIHSMITEMQARQYESDSNKRGGYNG